MYYNILINLDLKCHNINLIPLSQRKLLGKSTVQPGQPSTSPKICTVYSYFQKCRFSQTMVLEKWCVQHHFSFYFSSNSSILVWNNNFPVAVHPAAGVLIPFWILKKRQEYLVDLRGVVHPQRFSTPKSLYIRPEKINDSFQQTFSPPKCYFVLLDLLYLTLEKFLSPFFFLGSSRQRYTLNFPGRPLDPWVRPSPRGVLCILLCADSLVLHLSKRWWFWDGLGCPPFAVFCWHMKVTGWNPRTKKKCQRKTWWWLLLGRGTSQMIVEKRCREMWWIHPTGKQLSTGVANSWREYIPVGFFLSYSGFHLGQQLCTMSGVKKTQHVFEGAWSSHLYAFNIRVHYVSAAFYTYHTYFHPTYFTQTWSKICETSTASWHVLCIGPTSKDHWQWPFKDLVFS